MKTQRVSHFSLLVRVLLFCYDIRHEVKYTNVFFILSQILTFHEEIILSRPMKHLELWLESKHERLPRPQEVLRHLRPDRQVSPEHILGPNVLDEQ